MRIVIITWEYPPRVVGNIATYVDKLASVLAHGGLDVSVVTFHDSQRGVEKQKDGVTVLRVGNPVDPNINILTWDLTLSDEIERLVSNIYYSVKGKVDLIDAQEWLSVVPCVVLKEMFHIPFIFSIDTLEEHRSNYGDLPLNIAIKNIERLGTKESCKILVKSEWMKNEVMRLHGKSDRIVSIPIDSPTWAVKVNEFYQGAVER